MRLEDRPDKYWRKSGACQKEDGVGRRHRRSSKQVTWGARDVALYNKCMTTLYDLGKLKYSEESYWV